MFDAVLEVANAHGLTEQAGWCEYARCEALWVLGDLDGAVAAGERALAGAERYAYQRLAFRTFMILLPIAAERRDAATADRWDRWWAEAERHFPANPSAYGRMLRGAYLVALSRIRGGAERAGRSARRCAAADRQPALHRGGGGDRPGVAPHGAPRSRGGRGRSGRRGGGRGLSSPLMRASAALIEAWVSGSPAAAARAAEIAAAIPAPWWELRAKAAMR